MSDVSVPCGISGLSIDSTFLSPLFFFYLLQLLFLSCPFFFCLWPILLFFVCFVVVLILQYFSFRDRLFCMAPVQQLGEVSRLVVCAACCHKMAPVFAVLHLYNILYIASVHSFFFFFFLSFLFYFFFLNLVLIN